MKKSSIILILIFSVAFLLGTRKALVIGIGDYGGNSLGNAINDAQDMALVLTGVGYRVTLKTNVTLKEFDNTVDEFVTSIRPTDEILFYYSGHGVQYNGENFLIPANADIAQEVDLKYDAVNANRLAELMQKACISILVLDACRDNPFRKIRSNARGLATMEALPGSQYIIFSTNSGNTAEDGAGRNSPFTKALLKYIPEPGMEIAQLLRSVSREVATQTNNRQIPSFNGYILDEYYFIKAPKIDEPQMVKEEITNDLVKTQNTNTHDNAPATINQDKGKDNKVVAPDQIVPPVNIKGENMESGPVALLNPPIADKTRVETPPTIADRLDNTTSQSDLYRSNKTLYLGSCFEYNSQSKERDVDNDSWSRSTPGFAYSEQFAQFNYSELSIRTDLRTQTHEENGDDLSNFYLIGITTGIPLYLLDIKTGVQLNLNSHVNGFSLLAERRFGVNQLYYRLLGEYVKYNVQNEGDDLGSYINNSFLYNRDEMAQLSYIPETYIHVKFEFSNNGSYTSWGLSEKRGLTDVVLKNAIPQTLYFRGMYSKSERDAEVYWYTERLLNSNIDLLVSYKFNNMIELLIEYSNIHNKHVYDDMIDETGNESEYSLKYIPSYKIPVTSWLSCYSSVGIVYAQIKYNDSYLFHMSRDNRIVYPYTCMSNSFPINITFEFCPHNNLNFQFKLRSDYSKYTINSREEYSKFSFGMSAGFNYLFNKRITRK